MADSAQKTVLLGLTGGIAAYKAAELARLLIKDGFQVQAAMTEAARHFVGAATLQAITGRPVYTELWDVAVSNSMAHINLGREADLILVAPASADFLAKLANGAADDLLSTLCLARDCPLMVAPAMNRQMWDNPATQRNLATLRQDGVTVLGPASGDQACGETGMGRMLEAEILAQAVRGFFQPKSLSGTRVLITAGPTFEAMDTVRGITNRSSGRMGYAVTQAALDAGAEVTLVSGPVALTAPAAASVVKVESAQQMFDAVKAAVKGTDIFIGVAAVADYRPVEVSGQKIKKGAETMRVDLTRNPDILEYVASLPKPPLCVGFAAESEQLEAHAQEKRRRKKLALVAANLAHTAIGAEDNELILFDDAGRHLLPRAPKEELARHLVEHIAKLYRTGRGRRPAPRRK
ncbi:MAG TPA: bifunctional phosphopantothenoylcysteine decarboxylase/phosphopantothenate--cysteine ligase CoaBC [Burkholderiales bacterium]|nr:bifunctional phosphopantothenoylcysteine decarboxylase/phosphopantothenate--cysteine ligase CoaBC [Burkholderiales bacterium]